MDTAKQSPHWRKRACKDFFGFKHGVDTSRIGGTNFFDAERDCTYSWYKEHIITYRHGRVKKDEVKLFVEANLVSYVCNGKPIIA